jgi:hypothetical protein
VADITRRKNKEVFTRPTTVNHTFVLTPFHGYVLEVEDIRFHHDSAVFLPDHGNAPDANRVTGLSILAAAYDHAKKNPQRQLLDAGHTDTTGADAYNIDLSIQRADNVKHALMGNRDPWVSGCKAKHKTEDYQQILKWAAWTYGWDCDPGPIDNVHGSKTSAGVKSFQKNYNIKFSQSIAEDGVVGSQTWGAFFDCYMDSLKNLMRVDDAGLAEARGRIKFMNPDRVGCGENFPIEASRTNNYRSEINRRVELIFFDPDQLPKMDCHPGGSACNAILCEVYNPKMYKYTHITPTPIPPRDVTYDLTNVKSPDHIAPEKEKIKIEYDIVNPDDAITSAKLEILRKKDSKVLKTFTLTKDQYKEGHHAEFEWDGAIDANPDFPDSFVTIEHSDYTAKVTISGPKGDKSGTTDIKVELKDFKVELAPKATLKEDKDKKVYDQVGTIPAGSLVKLKLKSNFFTVDGTGDEMTDQTLFNKYKEMWDEGPRVPLIAIATVIDSKGNAVACGKAMGKARVLWDFTDPAQTLTTYLATAFTPPPATSNSKGAKPFVDKAIAFKKAASKPKDGDNAHMDHGGKRGGSASVPLVFQAADSGVQNFPFKVARGGTRFWASFGEFEKSGADEGKAGAVFRPSRMAGDNYSVTAYLDIPFKLDKTDEKPSGAEREVKVGDFETWREVTLAEHFKKGSQTTGTMPTFAEYYADAYVEVKNESGGVKDMTKAEYDAAFTTAFAAAGGNALLRKYGLAPGGQWDSQPPPAAASPTSFIATFLPFNQFRAAVSAGESVTGAALQTLLNTNSCGDPAKHGKQAELLAKAIGDELVRAKSTKDGITVVQFTGVTNLDVVAGTGLLGRAVSQTAEARRARGGFMLVSTVAGAAQTPAHEIGHLMFLPHAPRIDASDGSVISTGGGITKDFHDKDNRNCLMSYARPRPGFCGLCLIRLRGWKGDAFDENGPKP